MTKITKLRDVVIEHPTVDISGGFTLEVRPLNMIDLMTLVSTYGPQVSMSYSKLVVMAKAGTLSEKDVVGMLETLLEECPQLLSAVLAMACGDDTPEGREAAAGLPLVDQLALFDALIRETMGSEATVKKLLASLSLSAMQVFGALKTMKAPISKSSTGLSDAK